MIFHMSFQVFVTHLFVRIDIENHPSVNQFITDTENEIKTVHFEMLFN